MAHLCNVCASGWEIQDGENYCGWCNSSTLGFSLSLEGSETLYYHDEINEPLILRVTIKNTGIQLVQLDKPELSGGVK